MSAKPLSHESVTSCIETLRRQMGDVITTHGTPHIAEVWQTRWNPELDKLLIESRQRPEVAVSLVGGTGSGKSTLVNALLDARILPVSNMRACTAAISEVSFLEGNTYRAAIEFISRESWRHEMDLLLQDIADETAREVCDDGEPVDNAGISRAARDKLKAVYRIEDDADLRQLRAHDLHEPQDIAHALDRGTIEVASDSLDEFRTHVKSFLDSRHAYWPIVKTVRIRGPFAALANGATIVDLPGINDPNEAREQVTKTYLKTCRFVWITFNIKRVLTRDVRNLMQSDDFVRQIVMDGREGALTFVGTCSDDIDLESGREEFALDDDCSPAEVVVARNDAARTEVADQVWDLARRAARNAGDEHRTAALSDAFLKSEIFTVSARDYLHLKGLARNKSNSLDRVEDTQVPRLRQHLKDICAGFGVEALAKAHHHRIEVLLDEIERELGQEKALLQRQRDLSAQARKEMTEAIERLVTFLGCDLDDHRERFAQDLRSKQELLQERLRRATDRGRAELDHVVELWGRIHWATLRAVARRGGQFNSPTSGQYDFANDIAKPVLDSITFAWTDFFGDKLGQTLELWCDKLSLCTANHRNNVIQALAGNDDAARDRLADDLAKVMEVTGKLVREMLGQMRGEMDQKIDGVRRNLYESIPEQIAANMRPAFSTASQESGTGMKARMIEIIARHAREVSKVMFNDAEEAIGAGVRSMNDWLVRKFAEITDGILRQSKIPVANLLQAETVPAEQLNHWISDIEQMQGVADIVHMENAQFLYGQQADTGDHSASSDTVATPKNLAVAEQEELRV